MLTVNCRTASSCIHAMPVIDHEGRQTFLPLRLYILYLGAEEYMDFRQKGPKSVAHEARGCGARGQVCLYFICTLASWQYVLSCQGFYLPYRRSWTMRCQLHKIHRELFSLKNKVYLSSSSSRESQWRAALH